MNHKLVRKIGLILLTAFLLWMVLPALLLLLPILFIFGRGKSRSSRSSSARHDSLSEEMFGVSPHHDGFQE